MIRRYAFIVLSLAFLFLTGAHPSWADQRRVEYNVAREAITGAVSFECAGDDCDALVAELTGRLRALDTISGNADAIVDCLHIQCFENLAQCQSGEPTRSRIHGLNTLAVELRSRWVEKFVADVLKWDALKDRQMDLSLSFTTGIEARDICGTRTPPVDSCQSSWPDIQAQYKQNPEMLALIKYRRRLTDGLIAQAALETLEEDISIKGLPFWQVEPSGSYSYTSDLDVTIVGLDAGLAVEKFNVAFRRHFGKEPGILLDSNVYADPFTPTEKRDKRVQAIMQFPDGDSSKQDSLALVKLRRYMTADEWTEFCGKIMSMPPPAKEAHRKRLDRGEALYKAYVDALYKEILKNKGRKAAPLTSFSQKERFLHDCEEGAEYCSKNDHMNASNVLYARNLEKFRNALRNLVEIAPEERSPAQYDYVKEALGIANIFANEAYIAQGPHLHVLGLIQAPEGPLKNKIRESLTNAQILASINEQVGDALKDIGHYKSNFGKAVYKCAKYVDRLRDGLKRILENVGQQGASIEKGPLASNVERILKEIDRLPIDSLLEIRKGAWKPAGQTSDATDAQKDSEAKRLAQPVADNIESFRGWIVRLAKEINAGLRTSTVFSKSNKMGPDALCANENEAPTP